MRRIVIIGGGFSGTLVAVHLLRAGAARAVAGHADEARTHSRELRRRLFNPVRCLPAQRSRRKDQRR